MLTALKVATPATAAMGPPPLSVPAPGLATNASVTGPVNAGVVFPCASWAVTTIAGSGDPADPPAGGVVNTSCVVGPGLTLNAALVTPAGGAPAVGVAVSV